VRRSRYSRRARRSGSLFKGQKKNGRQSSRLAAALSLGCLEVTAILLDRFKPSALYSADQLVNGS
jgi:hypothetical protein